MTDATPQNPPALSLIVATVGRPDALRRLFRSLTSQRCADFEVILVDQCDDPGITAKVVSEFSARLCLRYVRDKSKGLSSARNKGLRLAMGELVGFPDDDCWYDETVVESVKRAFRDSAGLGMLCGIYTEPGVDNLSFPRGACRLTPGRIPGRVCSVGLFIRRICLRDYDAPFDEGLGAGTDLPAGEEADLALRMVLAGVHARFAPSLVIYHPIMRPKHNDQMVQKRSRRAFWYVIGKNYRPVFSEFKVMRGLLACVLRGLRAGSLPEAGTIIGGYRQGRRSRAT